MCIALFAISSNDSLSLHDTSGSCGTYSVGNDCSSSICYCLYFLTCVTDDTPFKGVVYRNVSHLYFFYHQHQQRSQSCFHFLNLLVFIPSQYSVVLETSHSFRNNVGNFSRYLYFSLSVDKLCQCDNTSAVHDAVTKPFRYIGVR